MPPHADKQLEERILKVAQQLWKSQGEHGLTLRAVAKAAGTTTPTVYKRFRNREALLVAVAIRIRDQATEKLLAAKGIEGILRGYVAWAEDHPHEYQLLFRFWAEAMHPDRPRPGRASVMAKMAERYGGTAEGYAQPYTALFLLAHGTASLLTTTTDDVAKKEIRDYFLQSADALLRNFQALRA